MDLKRYSAMEYLRDGRMVKIRALLPADREALVAAVHRMSDESMYRRFFSAKKQFSEREVEFFTNVDFVDHVALVAVVEEDTCPLIVGGARYVVDAPGSAEVAFAVDDAHQGLGIGGLLMKHLVAIARNAGLQRLNAEVLSDNAAMLKVFEKSGLPLRCERDRDTRHVALALS